MRLGEGFKSVAVGVSPAVEAGILLPGLCWLRVPRCATPPPHRGICRFPLSAFRLSAFTLIEIMIVIAIMGVVLTMGVPVVYKAWHKAPLTKEVSEIMEVCSHARALSIMQGKEVDVVFHPKEGRFEVGASPPSTTQTSDSGTLGSTRVASLPMSGGASGGAVLSGKLSDKIAIELMDINKLPHEFREDDLARVRFFPNGTCDELTLILVSDKAERRELTLEVTTGLMNVESDPRRFK